MTIAEAAGKLDLGKNHVLRLAKAKPRTYGYRKVRQWVTVQSFHLVKGKRVPNKPYQRMMLVSVVDGDKIEMIRKARLLAGRR